jgi:hypothetical protein
VNVRNVSEGKGNTDATVQGANDGDVQGANDGDVQGANDGDVQGANDGDDGRVDVPAVDVNVAGASASAGGDNEASRTMANLPCPLLPWLTVPTPHIDGEAGCWTTCGMVLAFVPGMLKLLEGCYAPPLRRVRVAVKVADAKG